MNILQINTLDKKGGAARVAYSIKNGLETRGYRTSMFVRKKYSQDKNIFEIGGHGKLLKTLSRITGRSEERILSKISYILADDIDIFRSDQILESPQFKEADIVHCHNLHSYYFNLNTLVKMSVQKPVVWTLHDMWSITPHCAHSFDGKLENGFYQCPNLNIYPPIAWHNEKNLMRKKRRIYEKTNLHIIVPSKWLADKVSKSVLQDKDLRIINNGINTAIFKDFSREKAREELGLPTNKKIILFVAKGGKLNPWKGWKYFEKISKNNPDILFLVIGTEEKVLQNNIKHINFIDSNTTMAKYYSASDLLLYPSLADNCPLVILEAMSCGVPVVSFNTGGVPEILKHKEGGYVANYEDFDDLQQGIEYVLNMGKDRYTKVRTSNRRLIETKFSENIMIQKYIMFYNILTKSTSI